MNQWVKHESLSPLVKFPQQLMVASSWDAVFSSLSLTDRGPGSFDGRSERYREDGMEACRNGLMDDLAGS